MLRFMLPLVVMVISDGDYLFLLFQESPPLPPCVEGSLKLTLKVMVTIAATRAVLM